MQDAFAMGVGDGVGDFGEHAQHGVTRGVFAARPEVNVLVRRLRSGGRGANTGNGQLDGPQARIG